MTTEAIQIAGLDSSVAGKGRDVSYAQRFQVGKAGDLVYIGTDKPCAVEAQLLDRRRAVHELQECVVMLCKEKDDALQVREFTQTSELWIRKITPKVNVSNGCRRGCIGQEFLNEPRVRVNQAVDFSLPELLHLVHHPTMALPEIVPLTPG
jgi:hypothetical protein